MYIFSCVRIDTETSVDDPHFASLYSIYYSITIVRVWPVRQNPAIGDGAAVFTVAFYALLRRERTFNGSVFYCKLKSPSGSRKHVYHRHRASVCVATLSRIDFSLRRSQSDGSFRHKQWERYFRMRDTFVTNSREDMDIDRRQQPEDSLGVAGQTSNTHTHVIKLRCLALM